MTCFEVVDRGTGDARKVDAVMLVEALVLNGHSGVLHDYRDLPAGHHDAVHRSIDLGDLLAAAVVDHSILAELLGAHRVDVRKVVGDGDDRAADEAHDADRGEDHKTQQQTAPVQPRAPRRATLAAPLGRGGVRMFFHAFVVRAFMG